MSSAATHDEMPTQEELDALKRGFKASLRRAFDKPRLEEARLDEQWEERRRFLAQQAEELIRQHQTPREK